MIKKTFILLFLLVNFYSFSQIERNEKELSKLKNKTLLIDSLIKKSQDLAFHGKLITTRISEGSIKLFNDAGSGGFTIYTYTNSKTKKIVKARYNTTIHYNHNKNINSERIEISIYFKGEKPYYAEFNEYHYTNEEVISTTKYQFQINPDRKNIYYSNDFQKEITEYILNLSNKILSKK